VLDSKISNDFNSFFKKQKMRKFKAYSIFLVLLSLCITTQHNAIGQIQQLPQLGKSPIQQIVEAMTLEEKAQFVVGNGFRMPGTAPQGPVLGHTEDRVPGAAGTTFAIPRLGIPGMVISDGPAGVRIDPFRNKDSSKTYYATAWPVGTLLASSWDTALVKKVGQAFGEEVREYGIDILLGPGMNIHRNPLGGRNFEYYSEDPVLTGYIAAAMVKGIQSSNVGTSIKHFAANNQEKDRNTVNTILSERALREIYLKGFEIAVKQAEPWTVMSSYNLINGRYTSENYDLLTTILKKEWGYKGFVMTDWFGGRDPVAQMKAGNNLLMPGTPSQSKKIIEAVKNGSLDEKVLDGNVAGILRIILKSPSFKGYKYSDKPDLKKDAEISRQAATEGMILLKNEENALPLGKSSHTIALVGINAYDLIAGGTGSGDVNKAYKVSLEQGLSNAGYAVDEDLKNAYTAYIASENAKRPKKGFFEEFMNPTPPLMEFAVDKELINKKAASSDIAIIAIGRNAGEGRDRKLEDDYNLSEAEKEMIKSVSEAFHSQHKKVIIVLNIGGVIDVSDLKTGADAILLAWQPGQEGGNAMVDVLGGKVNPSGKLPTSFPLAYQDVPSAKNFPGKEFLDQATTGQMGMKQIPAEVTYEEGIYVGYRYYNTFHIKNAYEFGYGLSYTNFSYGNLLISSPVFNNRMTATVTVTNSGAVAGKEVVQLYLSAPGKELDKPAEELKGFAKTNLLKPGESQTLHFILNLEDLASFDTQHAAWIAEKGVYTIRIGASSTNSKTEKTFELAKDWVAENVNKVLVPQVEINELKK
jgi:beta-glucosidase